jgi:hypothetical protein
MGSHCYLFLLLQALFILVLEPISIENLFNKTTENKQFTAHEHESISMHTKILNPLPTQSFVSAIILTGKFLVKITQALRLVDIAGIIISWL